MKESYNPFKTSLFSVQPEVLGDDCGACVQLSVWDLYRQLLQTTRRAEAKGRHLLTLGIPHCQRQSGGPIPKPSLQQVSRVRSPAHPGRDISPYKYASSSVL